MTSETPPGLWAGLVPDREAEILLKGGFARRQGTGRHPAILVIDAQNYMVGPDHGGTAEFPSACGRPARQALERLAPVLEAARRANFPVVYTRFVLRSDGLDAGVYGLKRRLPQVEGWALEGTYGAEISDIVAPRTGDVVLVKKKFSAFFGTHLEALLRDWGVDTVVVAGGSTSNCVRATVVDAASHNFRPLLVGDCVFDRVEISHRVALFDLDRQYADVVDSEEVIRYFEGLAGGSDGSGS